MGNYGSYLVDFDRLQLADNFSFFFSSDLRVGCFKVANNLTELRDLTGRVKWDNTNEAVRKCAKLAKKDEFKLFALGKGGVCLSGQDMKDKYLDSGTENAECRHGVGIGDSMFVYSLGKQRNFRFSFFHNLMKKFSL